MAAPFQKTNVGTIAAPLSAVPGVVRTGIEVQANPDNAPGSIVYVGFTGVTAADGWPLAPGASKLISKAHCPEAVSLDPSLVYVIGSTNSLKVSVWVF